MEKLKWIKKGISALLALNMVLSSVPLPAFAATTDNLCEHHTEHTAECGYREGSAGSACTHEHSEDCYKILNCLHECGTECEQGCTHECTVENGCITMELDCHHVHGDCGYSEGTAEVPCGHVHNESCGYVEVVYEVLCDCAETDESGNLIHTEGCGYVAAVEGQPCGHTACDDTCGYAPATEGTPCTHKCEVIVGSKESCYRLLCSHAEEGQHDKSCGYAAPIEGQACTFTCLECSTEPAESPVGEGVAAVQTMIDTLPTAEIYFAMTAEEQFVAQDALTAAYDAYTALSPEQQNQVDTTAMYALQKAVMNGGKTLEESTDPTQVSVTWCSLEFTYSKIWNPQTLQYDSEWTASDDGTITIQNDGTTNIIVTFIFESTAGITGTFSVNDLTIPAGETKTTQLMLSGEPSEDLNTTALGEIKVNVQQCDTE